MPYGNTGHVGISFQSSFGTSNTTSFHFMPFISETFQAKIPELVSEGMRSRYEEGPTFQGVKEVTGDLVTEVHPILIGKAMKAWANAAASSLQTSAYLHTFIPAQTEFDALTPVYPVTAEVYRATGSATLYYDLGLNNFNLEIAHGALLKATWSFVGGRFAKSVKSTPSYLIGSEFTWNQASISLGGTGFGTFKSLSFAFSNALKSYGTIDGTLYSSRMVRDGFRTLEISGVQILDGDTQKDLFLAGTAQNLTVTVVGQAVSSAHNAMLKIEVPAMIYTEFPDNVSGPGLIEVSWKAKAVYESGSGHMVKMTLVNTQAAY